ncbi:MBL fold metallo-hydrolase [Natrinema thermotolerans]|uniref:MBL fold metallo-hydrolase n=1 Tax=Natrinema thermotolerans TaxID=121872 RepID=A0AAF0PB54_9EURY|nr:MBL fold metallo-hydrolase [Natrinema thermotolerans]QCC61703.1 MBL fold metallo-hydrolase [Natrinema thermotolerans]WMT07885.1 MBL fold metallo-hydrolase [Natrinema thermotolerans]
MRVSYQHANINSGNESTLLRFTAADGTRACILVDAGDGVNLDTLLADDEYLNAILLTHPHIDHYRTLATNVRHSAPIYTADTTAAILEQALPEATQDNDLGDVSTALDALEPINEWTSILNGLEVRPIAAGHTPGGAGFLIRFHDETATDDPLHGEQHILISGDFTTRPCAGFPGLATSYPFDIDCLLLNVASNDSYTTSLNESLQLTLEHAYAGSRVVVAASSLTGVHYATLLGHCTEVLEREVPITLVGQAAKLYDSLEYDVSGVEPTAVFDRPNEVLADGGITIAGPETPTTGSTQRLLQAIGDDPAAAFVQLTMEDEVDPSDTRCTTQAFPLPNHPSSETISNIVHDIAPKEVVIKHANGSTLKEFQRRFDHCFTWGTNDTGVHCLYENGEWQVPDWITDSTASRIQSRQWDVLQEQPLETDVSLPRCRQRSVDLEAEGVDLDALEETFSRPIEDPYAGSDPGNDGSKAVARDTDDQQTDRSFEADVLARLEAIETTLEQSEETVSARVLSDGADTQVLELLEQANVEAGDVVDVTIKTEPSDD